MVEECAKTNQGPRSDLFAHLREQACYSVFEVPSLCSVITMGFQEDTSAEKVKNGAAKQTPKDATQKEKVSGSEDATAAPPVVS